MLGEIDKKTLEYLTALARVKIDESKMSTEKLIGDLKNILSHFEELKELDTTHVPPLSHGLALSTVLREDVASDEKIAKHEALLSALSAREGDFLKIPPVFKKEK